MKLILISSFIANIGINAYAKDSEVYTSNQSTVSYKEFKEKSPVDKAKMLHSDILQLIIDSLNTAMQNNKEINSIDGLTIDICKEELKKRLEHGDQIPYLPNKVDPKILTHEILNLIVHSPKSIGGVSPLEAAKEQLSRLNIFSGSMQGLITNKKIMEYYEYLNKQAIAEWDKNETNEAVEKFLTKASSYDDPTASEILELMKSSVQSNTIEDKLNKARHGEVNKPIYVDENIQTERTEEEIKKDEEKLKKSGTITEKVKSENLTDKIKSWFNFG